MTDVEIIEAKTRHDYARCIYLRTQIFINGQNVALGDEFMPDEDEAVTYLGLVNSDPVATGRYRLLDNGFAKIERVGVLEDCQGKGYGRELMLYLIDALKAQDPAIQIKISAQDHAIPFYEKIGFSVDGQGYMDAGIPHHAMIYHL